jgi:hypothetical protein
VCDGKRGTISYDDIVMRRGTMKGEYTVIGCHMGGGARIHNPLLISRELHVLESCKERWVELLMLLLRRLLRKHHDIVGVC